MQITAHENQSISFVFLKFDASSVYFDKIDAMGYWRVMVRFRAYLGAMMDGWKMVEFGPKSFILTHFPFVVRFGRFQQQLAARLGWTRVDWTPLVLATFGGDC